MSIKGQGHSLTLVKGHSDFNVKTCFSQKQLGDLEPKFIWQLEGEKEWKFIQMSWVTWPTWPPCPYMVKTLKNLLLQNHQTDDLETSYVALCMGVLPRLFKLWPWVDLDSFYTKVKFGHVGFCMGKSEKYLFFGNHCSLGSQSCLKQFAKWVIEFEWVLKVKVILWPWSKVTQISMLKLVFLKNSWAIWNQNSYERLREKRNENLYKWVGSHDQHGRHAHIWQKT